jgi:hypothetical protein
MGPEAERDQCRCGRTNMYPLLSQFRQCGQSLPPKQGTADAGKEEGNSTEEIAATSLYLNEKDRARGLSKQQRSGLLKDSRPCRFVITTQGSGAALTNSEQISTHISEWNEMLSPSSETGV